MGSSASPHLDFSILVFSIDIYLAYVSNIFDKKYYMILKKGYSTDEGLLPETIL